MSIKDGIVHSEKAYDQLSDTSSMFATVVKEDFLFTWQWWLGIALFILPWVIWFILRDKEKTGRLLLGGLLTIILSLCIDLVALSTGLWSYPIVIIPIAPFLFLPYHFSLAPVGIMFALQIKPNMNPFIKGLIFAALAAFGGMNLFNAIGFYNPKNWSTFYDFLIFLSIYFAAYSMTLIDSFKRLNS